MSHMNRLFAGTPCSPNSLRPAGADCKPLTFSSHSTLRLLHHPFNSILTKHSFCPTSISSPEQNKPRNTVSGQPKDARFPVKFCCLVAALVSSKGLGSRCSIFLSRSCLSISNSPGTHRNSLLTSTSVCNLGENEHWSQKVLAGVSGR